jgi:hypothetical protein
MSQDNAPNYAVKVLQCDPDQPEVPALHIKAASALRRSAVLEGTVQHQHLEVQQLVAQTSLVHKRIGIQKTFEPPDKEFRPSLAECDAAVFFVDSSFDSCFRFWLPEPVAEHPVKFDILVQNSTLEFCTDPVEDQSGPVDAVQVAETSHIVAPSRVFMVHKNTPIPVGTAKITCQTAKTSKSLQNQKLEWWIGGTMLRDYKQ